MLSTYPQSLLTITIYINLIFIINTCGKLMEKGLKTLFEFLYIYLDS